LHAFTQFRVELNESQNQINTQRNPDLSQHSIFTGANERFDFQVLLDPFEK